MNKSAHTLVLSKWFSIDRALFGNNSPKSVMSESDFHGYITAKGAMLSCIYEIYNKLGFKPNVTFANLTQLREFGLDLGLLANKRAKEIMITENVSKKISKEIRSAALTENFNSADAQSFLVDQKIKNISLDVLMLEDALKFTGKKNKLNEWGGNVLLDAYKTLRTALVKYAY